MNWPNPNTSGKHCWRALLKVSLKDLSNVSDNGAFLSTSFLKWPDMPNGINQVKKIGIPLYTLCNTQRREEKKNHPSIAIVNYQVFYRSMVHHEHEPGQM